MFRTIVFVAFMTVAPIAIATAQPLSQEGDDACQIAALIDTSAALGLPSRVERAFLLTLRTAGDAYHQGDTQRAMTLLRTFSFEVRSVKRAKRLPAETAEMLIARAEDAMRGLERR